MTPTKTALRLMSERNILTCQVKGCTNPAEEAHHCLYGKHKGIKELNEDYNLQLVCRLDHKYNGRALTYANKRAFWEWACSFYGADRMMLWHESLPLKVKERGYY